MKIILATLPGFIDQNLAFLEPVLLGYQAQVEFPMIRVLPNNWLRFDKSVEQKQREKTSVNVQRSKAKSRLNKISKKKQRSFRYRLVQASLTFVMTISLSFSVFYWAPSVYYEVFPVERVAQATDQNETPMGGEFSPRNQAVKEGESDKNEAEEEAQEKKLIERYIPEKSDNLPDGDWLVISRIGVNSQLQKTESEKEALDKGLWWVPDFGEPGDLQEPMIVAGHRYGWDWWWRNEYWRYHSFNKLPELEPGDLVTVISDQRQWTYEIYAGEEGERISDYQADLILYTCKFLKSPVRIFRYARLIIPEGEG